MLPQPSTTRGSALLFFLCRQQSRRSWVGRNPSRRRFHRQVSSDRGQRSSLSVRCRCVISLFSASLTRGGISTFSVAFRRNSQSRRDAGSGFLSHVGLCCPEDRTAPCGATAKRETGNRNGRCLVASFLSPLCRDESFRLSSQEVSFVEQRLSIASLVKPQPGGDSPSFAELAPKTMLLSLNPSSDNSIVFYRVSTSRCRWRSAVLVSLSCPVFHGM